MDNEALLSKITQLLEEKHNDQQVRETRMIRALGDVHEVMSTQEGSIYLQPRVSSSGQRPALFTGVTSQDPELWLKLYEEYFSYAEPNRPDSPRKAFGNYLSGAAQTWYFDQKINEIQEWTQVKKTFKEFFEDVPESVRRECVNTLMHKREKIEDFIAKASNAYRILKLSDSDKLTRFTDALLSHYRTEVLKSNPKTFQEAVLAAKKAGKTLAHYDQMSDPAEVAKAVTQALSELQIVGRKSNQSSTDSHIVSSLEERLNSLESRLEQRLTTSLAAIDRQSSQVRHSDQDNAPIVCYCCGGRGHISRECPSKKSESTYRSRHSRGRGRGRDRGRGNYANQDRRGNSPARGISPGRWADETRSRGTVQHGRYQPEN